MHPLVTVPTYSYPNGRGPATESAIATADRMLASITEIEAAHAAKIRSMLALAKPEQLPLALTDASDVFGNDEPAWMATHSDPCADIDATMRLLGGDPVRLREESPADYLAFGSFLVAFKQASEHVPYVAKPGAGSDLRYSLYQTGVIGGMR